MVIDNFIGKDMVKIKIQKDHYFVAGDYRFNSLDSRYFGPITKDSIIGKVITFNQPLFKKLSNILDEQMSKW
jgi:type IV secretory pathway protease TraF